MPEETPRKPINAIRCKRCKEVIISTHRHDFRQCTCGQVFVDGGKDYKRRGYPGGPNPYIFYEEIEFEDQLPKDDK